jgi:hypothetical protein
VQDRHADDGARRDRFARWRRQLDLEPAAPREPVALAAHPPVDHDVAGVGDVGRRGAGEAEQP